MTTPRGVFVAVFARQKAPMISAPVAGIILPVACCDLRRPFPAHCATAGVNVQQAKGILITALVAVAVVALYHNDMIPGIKGAKKLGA